MAKVESIETPDELKLLQRNALEESDRFLLSVVQAHKSLPSDKRKKVIKDQSLFKFLAPLWRALSSTEKNVWRDAGVFSGITNWQLFISDNAARIRGDVPLDVPPSDIWQVRAGQFIIEAPATEMILKQEHPQSYFVSRKIVGAPWKNELVKLEENFSFPLTLGISYKSDLIPVGDEQRARFYASVRSSFQGVDRFTDLSLDFDPQSDWTALTDSINRVIGHVIGYTLYLEVVGYRGTLLFDNIRAVHGGTNWALDPRCDEINKTFTKAFAIVPPFWVPVSLPVGAAFSSQFPPAL